MFNQQDIKRDSFGSKLGVLAAAAGSAIGLGNIWRFPYITGKYGGAAFILVYLACIAIVGVPVMLSEFIIGRKAHKNVVEAFGASGGGRLWHAGGWIALTAGAMLLAFYSVIAGWALHYLLLSATNWLQGLTPQEMSTTFGNLVVDPVFPTMWHVVFMALTSVIVFFGVRDGIEKATKVMMPALVVILFLMAMRSLTLPGAYKGIDFLFTPNWSALRTHPEAVMIALGHAFFSLSLGIGAMVTYGSYMKKEVRLGSIAFQVATADTAVSILAGIAVIPAVFAFGIAPGSGPGLVFITLPSVFQQMAGGYVFGILFFLLLTMAALTSSISILEVIVTYLVETRGMERMNATIGSAVTIGIFGVVCSLSLGVFDFKVFPFLSGGNIEFFNFFDIMDKVSANAFMPMAGLLAVIYVCWVMKKSEVFAELKSGGSRSFLAHKIYYYVAKFLTPIAIIVVFIYNLGLIKF